MKSKLIIFSAAVLMFCAGQVFAQGTHDHGGHEDTMMGEKDSMKEHQGAGRQESQAAEAGNKICPVSGQKVGEMGPAVTVEHNGKIYNLCCPACVEMFKADPDKYVKIVEDEMGAGKGHEGHHHVMGEMDMGLMTETDENAAKAAREKVSMSEAPVKEIDVEAYRYAYSPEEIVVHEGDHVVIHATSRDVAHGFGIEEYGINAKVEKDKVTDIEFIADKPGRFDIICTVYCGAGHPAMKAKLIVEPK